LPHHEITPELAERLKAQVERGFNERDPRAIEQVLSPQLIDHNVLLGGADLRQRMARAQDAFEDATYSIDEYIVQGSAVAWRWTIRGTHTKRVMGVEPTLRQVSISGLSAAVIHGGKIVEHWEFSDDQAVLDQLQTAAQRT
jgi:predicted ester cyclase